MPSKPPKVSVVIPAYNAMSYLPETVESALSQTFTDFEVLIIDDGSSDNIVRWFTQLTDPRLKLISQKNQGVSAARNVGIAHAQGMYLALLDADDLWEPSKLEKQVRCLEDNPKVGLVYTWVWLINELGKPTGRMGTPQAKGDVWQKLLEFKPVCCCGSTPLIRRCCFETVGVFDRNLSGLADWDMWVRIASHYSFALIKQPLVFYRQHPNSMSTDYQGLLNDFHTAIEKAFRPAPSNLLYLKARGSARFKLYLSWKLIETWDYKAASHFRQQILAHYPQLIYSWEVIRLSIAIMVLRWFGPQTYDGLRLLPRAWRRHIANARLKIS